jgi:hypothetical protein
MEKSLTDKRAGASLLSALPPYISLLGVKS